MRRRLRTAAAGLVVAGAAFWVSPLLLRQLSFFQVRQVELVGLRYLPPESVLVHLGLQSDRNLFESNRDIERRAAEFPGVVSARTRRRVPGTLRVTFLERPAIALAPGPSGMVPLDTAGHPLPYNPEVTGLDLPVLPRADPELVRALWRVRVSDSGLYGEIQSARRLGRGAVVLDLGRQELVIPGVPSHDQIRAIGVVREHLALAGQQVRRLDARFGGRVFARREGV